MQKIITLCGSTKFKNVFLNLQKELTLKGYIVLTVECFGHVDYDYRIKLNKNLLDKIHKQKIDMSDAILVIDINGYIGKSTKSEIEYAKSKNKYIFYLSKLIQMENKEWGIGDNEKYLSIIEGD